MENVVVIYKTKTGFTENYAHWIAEALDCEAYPLENVNMVDLSDYDLIILGGGIRAGRIGGIGFVKKIQKLLPNTRLIIFATGATPATEAAEIERFRMDNLPPDSNLPFFYFQSGFNYQKMRGFDRVLVNLARRIMAARRNKEGPQNEILSAIEHSFDRSSRKAIEPLVRYVRALT